MFYSASVENKKQLLKQMKQILRLNSKEVSLSIV